MAEAMQYSASALWRNLLVPGMDCCTLQHISQGWRLEGSVVQLFEGQPGKASYQVECDDLWRTRAVLTELDIGGVHRSLHLTVAEGHWYAGPEEQIALRNCVDIDLGLTPATNTLPIRRATLAIGEHRDVVAAWISFPALRIEPLFQRYTRLEAMRYRYETFDNGDMSGEPAFSVELSVDHDGLVQEYSGWWERVSGQ